jgi:hypothetical protein
MSEITINDVRKYVEEKGPKKIKDVDGPVDYLFKKILEQIAKVPKEKRSGWYRNDVPARIQEIIPEEGQILLSGKNGKVIIYDIETKSYREAAFDISKGQPVSTSKSFELNGYTPSSSLETIFFSKYSGEATHFLEKALELFDAPVVEIGKHIGDTHNRYFSMRKYSK